LAELRIELLGPFRVSVGGRAVTDVAWRRRKPAALVKLLALAPAHRLHREQIMDALGPELDPAAAGANLRKALHYARRALDSLDGARLISSDADRVWLPRDEMWLDLEAFRSAGRRPSHGRPRGVPACPRRYRDGLLPEDRYEGWAVGPRDELHLEFLPADGKGSCYIEFGDGNVGKVDADFRTGPTPSAPFIGPSQQLASEKVRFAATRRQRWFAGRVEDGSEPT
jgi:hypothetical protein